MLITSNDKDHKSLTSINSKHSFEKPKFNNNQIDSKTKHNEQKTKPTPQPSVGGWVVLYICAWRTHSSSCMNESTASDPEAIHRLQAIYDAGLNAVVRIGYPYVVRDHADTNCSAMSFTKLAAAYARVVASFPLPPVTFGGVSEA